MSSKKSEKQLLHVSMQPQKKVAVNKVFLQQLSTLLGIAIPSFQSSEFLLLLAHTFFLVSRTFASIFLAHLDGKLVKDVVERNPKQFQRHLFAWIALAIPSTFITSMIKYLDAQLAVAFRARLMDVLYTKYMRNQTYYRVSNLDSRLNNVDQCLTEDVSRFCGHLAHLYSQLSKPFLDIVLMGGQLALLSKSSIGGGAKSTLAPALGGVAAVIFTAKVLQYFSPPFGKLAAEQAKLDGDLRFEHSRIITHAEEIAFYRGEKVEEETIRASFSRLIHHVSTIFKSRILYNSLEGFLMKYVWNATGLLMIALPSFAAKSTVALNQTVSDRTEAFITASGLLGKSADAVERILSAYKDVNELAGYTDRVSEMFQVFDDVANGIYEKTTVGDIALRNEKRKKKLLQQNATTAVIENNTDTHSTEISTEVIVDITKQKGISKTEKDVIRLLDVPIVSPNGDVLVEKISIDIKPGMHLLITGPNGCGKSSLFRIIGGLWPVHGGQLIHPPSGDVFYIPQRPFLTQSTLRDQVIFPHTVDDMHAANITDDDLLEILDWVSLAHIHTREGGWETKNEWADVLSGGEKQRIGMARLFYHKPRFAILDECTSAVSIDVEGKMYTHAIDLGITLLTVTHRPSLWKYHTHLLQFDGQGSVFFSELNASARMSLKEEKSKLEGELSGIPSKLKRLKELCQSLGEDSVHLGGS